MPCGGLQGLLLGSIAKPLLIVNNDVASIPGAGFFGANLAIARQNPGGRRGCCLLSTDRNDAEFQPAGTPNPPPRCHPQFGFTPPGEGSLKQAMERGRVGAYLILAGTHAVLIQAPVRGAMAAGADAGAIRSVSIRAPVGAISVWLHEHERADQFQSAPPVRRRCFCHSFSLWIAEFQSAPL